MCVRFCELESMIFCVRISQGQADWSRFSLKTLLQIHEAWSRQKKKKIESVHFTFLQFSSSLDGISSFSIRFHLYFNTLSCDQHHQPWFWKSIVEFVCSLEFFVSSHGIRFTILNRKTFFQSKRFPHNYSIDRRRYLCDLKLVLQIHFVP